jgi:hypothetical protein
MGVGIRTAGSARTVGPSGLCGLNPVSGSDRPLRGLTAERRARRDEEGFRCGRCELPARPPRRSITSRARSARAFVSPRRGRSLPDTGFSPHRPEGPTVRAEPAVRIPMHIPAQSLPHARRSAPSPCARSRNPVRTEMRVRYGAMARYGRRDGAVWSARCAAGRRVDGWTGMCPPAARTASSTPPTPREAPPHQGTSLGAHDADKDTAAQAPAHESRPLVAHLVGLTRALCLW